MPAKEKAAPAYEPPADATPSPFLYRKVKAGFGEPNVERIADGVRLRVVSKEIRDAIASGTVEGYEPADTSGKVKPPSSTPRRGRPPKISVDISSKAVSHAVKAGEYGVIAGAFFATFAVASKQDHWKLSDDEQKKVGDALAGVVPQLPANVVRRMSKASPWIKLSLVGAQVLGPRIVVSQSIVAAAKRKKTEPATPTPSDQLDAAMADAMPPQMHTNGKTIVFPMPITDP